MNVHRQLFEDIDDFLVRLADEGDPVGLRGGHECLPGDASISEAAKRLSLGDGPFY